MAADGARAAAPSGCGGSASQVVPENDPETRARTTAFQQGLAALDWVEGRNIRIVYRFAAAGDAARIQSYVAELLNAAPGLIVANGTPVVAALKQATATIPIVFAIINDPVGQGFVASLALPGGKSRPRESEQGDKWSFCLTAGTLCPANQERQ